MSDTLRPATATIRDATPDDAESLSALSTRLFIRTFVEGFQMGYPEEDLAHYLEDAFSVGKVRSQILDPANHWLVAERDNQAVGYAYSGPCALPHPEVTPGCGELKRLYVDESMQGTGLGGQLLDQSLAWLEAQGRSRIWIGVWSGNLRAQAVYARRGFSKVGEYEYPVGRVRDHEFILRRA
jgi:ribosomal protein S18 acetylase RimI-like enzyme